MFSPAGFLDQETLKPFYSVTGTDQSSLKYTPGAERIPNNWYTRAAGDTYDVLFFCVGLQDPRTISYGSVDVWREHRDRELFYWGRGWKPESQYFTPLSMTANQMPLDRCTRAEFARKSTNRNLTGNKGGLYNSEILLQGNNLACFLFRSVAVAAPDLVRHAGVLSNIQVALSQFNNAVAQAVSSFGCPRLSQYS